LTFSSPLHHIHMPEATDNHPSRLERGCDSVLRRRTRPRPAGGICKCTVAAASRAALLVHTA
jgi:hypothetical protein